MKFSNMSKRTYKNLVQCISPSATQGRKFWHHSMFLMLNVRFHLSFKSPVWDLTGNKRAEEPAALGSSSPAAPNCHVTPLQLIHTLLFEKRAFGKLHTAVITGEMTGLFLPQPHLPLPVPAISTQSAKCHETEPEISKWHPIHRWNDAAEGGSFWDVALKHHAVLLSWTHTIPDDS